MLERSKGSIYKVTTSNSLTEHTRSALLNYIKRFVAEKPCMFLKNKGKITIQINDNESISFSIVKMKKIRRLLDELEEEMQCRVEFQAPYWEQVDYSQCGTVKYKEKPLRMPIKYKEAK